MIKKIEFSKYIGFRDTEKIIIEFEDDATEEEIQEEFESWVWEDIGDNYNWSEISNK